MFWKTDCYKHHSFPSLCYYCLRVFIPMCWKELFLITDVLGWYNFYQEGILFLLLSCKFSCSSCTNLLNLIYTVNLWNLKMCVPWIIPTLTPTLWSKIQCIYMILYICKNRKIICNKYVSILFFFSNL